MTASKISRGGGASKATKVVSSTLAGVLAVGMIPAAGFAAEGAADEGAIDAQSNEDISFLNLEGDQVVNGTILLESGQSGDTFPANGATTKYLKPASPNVLQLQGTTGADNQKTLDAIQAITSITGNDSVDWSAAAFYYVPVDSNASESVFYNGSTALKLDVASALAADDVDDGSGFGAGQWALVLGVASKTGSDITSISAVCKNAAVFTIEAKSLEGATFYEVVDNETDYTDTTFTYNGAATTFGSLTAGNINLVLNGESLTYTEDYIVTQITKGGIAVGYSAPSTTDALPAGDYMVTIKGQNDYASNEAIVLPLTISPINLANATIVVPNPQIPTAGSLPESEILKTLTVNGKTLDDLGIAASDLSWVTASSLNITKVGSYPFTFSINNTADKDIRDSIIGTGSTNVVVTSNDDLAKATQFYYDDTQIQTASTSSITTNLSLPADQQQVFDASKVAVYVNSQSASETNPTGPKVPASALTYRVTNAQTKEVTTLDALSTPGKYEVVIVVDPAKTTPAYSYGGESYPITVNVNYGTVQAADVEFVVNGDAVTGSTGSVTYTGEPIDIAVNALVNNAPVDPSDYTMTITDSKGNEVEDVVDVDTYTITVKSVKYNMTATMTLIVAAKDVTVAKVADTFTIGDDDNCLLYTGEAISPVIQYNANASTPSADPDYQTIPADAYTVKYKNAKTNAVTDELIDPGTYELTITAATGEGANKNYTVTDADPKLAVTVYDGKIFSDVASGDWFTPYVYTAAEQGYMTGVGGSAIFAPNNAITRADVTVVLSRMANSSWINTNDVIDFVSPFADVTNTKLYYYENVGWASSLGIVNGYAGTDDFGPNNSVTREQFATMMMRYAKVAGTYVAPEESTDAILAAYTDGAAVSDWARDAVAWCISEGMIQGVGGQKIINPSGNVTRAEVAKITTVFQPEKLEKPLTTPGA